MIPMAEPIVVEDLMRILARAKRAVATRDAEEFKHAQWDLEAIERPTDAHGWDTTKVALYAMTLMSDLLHPRKVDADFVPFKDMLNDRMADLRERQAYFDAKRANAAESDADFKDCE